MANNSEGIAKAERGRGRVHQVMRARTPTQKAHGKKAGEEAGGGAKSEKRESAIGQVRTRKLLSNFARSKCK